MRAINKDVPAKLNQSPAGTVVEFVAKHASIDVVQKSSFVKNAAVRSVDDNSNLHGDSAVASAKTTTTTTRSRVVPNHSIPRRLVLWVLSSTYYYSIIAFVIPLYFTASCHMTTTNSAKKNSNPIFVLSLPKSGTTTIHNFFLCGGYTSVHHRHRVTYLDQLLTNLLHRDMGHLVGKCIQHNSRKQTKASAVSLLDGCGNYQVWTDMSFAGPDGDCFFPSLHALEKLYESYPQATWILSTRNASDWYNSVSTFLGGHVLTKWENCQTLLMDHHPDCAAAEEENKLKHTHGSHEEHYCSTRQHFWINFYEQHTTQIRKFVKEHSSLQYVEIVLDDIDTPGRLSNEFHISKTCFGHYRQSTHIGNIILDRQETTLLWLEQLLKSNMQSVLHKLKGVNTNFVYNVFARYDFLLDWLLDNYY